MHLLLDNLQPWDFSPTVLACTLLALVIYWRGVNRLRTAGNPVGYGGRVAYTLGVVLLYVVLQTKIDYYAQHMFFVHRLQHLVLHHLGPFLIALSVPLPILRAGIPQNIQLRVVAPLRENIWVRGLLNVVLNPVVAAVMFVAGIGFWLIPQVHFAAMLSLPIYNMMNWSMVLDGLPFWLLVLDPQPSPPARMGYGMRIMMLAAITLPQLLMGAVISLTTHDLFKVYGICGRFYPIDPITDQQLGGLIIWIPGSMMSLLAMLIVFYLYFANGHSMDRRGKALKAKDLTLLPDAP
ncbi:MAG: cytochrome c oxidase assembly protein [Stenotrophobium sp.]